MFQSINHNFLNFNDPSSPKNKIQSSQSGLTGAIQLYPPFLTTLDLPSHWCLGLSVEHKLTFFSSEHLFLLHGQSGLYSSSLTFESRWLFPTLALWLSPFISTCFFFFFFATSYIYLCFVLPSDFLLIETVTLFYILSDFNKQLLRMNYEPCHMLGILDKEIQRYGILLKD